MNSAEEEAKSEAMCGALKEELMSAEESRHREGKDIAETCKAASTSSSVVLVENGSSDSRSGTEKQREIATLVRDGATASDELEFSVDCEDIAVSSGAVQDQNSTYSREAQVKELHKTAIPPSNLMYSQDFSEGGEQVQTLLLTLPMDSLHAIASFLSPLDWASFGLSSKRCTRICREIFHKVKMHGFRCATEVVTAWKLKQFADAKELCALYVGTGVPIYPYSLGHSYHTLVWRMGIEANETDAAREESSASSTTGEGDGETSRVRNPTDRFFVERDAVRSRETFSLSRTYLEEKAAFQLSFVKDARNIDANSLRRQMSLVPNRLAMRQPTDWVIQQREGSNAVEGRGIGRNSLDLRPLNSSFDSQVGEETGRGLKRSNSVVHISSRQPKAIVKLHRHLLDQHLLGHPSFDTLDGTMMTPPLSLSIDFFHPQFRFQQVNNRASANFTSSDGYVSGDLLPAAPPRLAPSQNSIGLSAFGADLAGMIPHPIANLEQQTDDSESEGEAEIQQVDAMTNLLLGANNEADDEHQSIATRACVNPGIPVCPNVLSSIDLDVYSASSLAGKKKGEVAEKKELRSHLRSRFASYERRLEMCLLQHDTNGFDEVMLDFWDEFLPQTSLIHYYDRHTAVPRSSCLDRFLSKPCPKAVGVVQCEIERIKVGSKKKGVSMKGRFFPTYEYRLFIRHRPQDGDEVPTTQRRDTVLMVARNRGRKHVENTVPSKKGSNNYFLYTPQHSDLVEHYDSVNEDRGSKVVTNGASNLKVPKHDPNLMGRLQSNFIGTEFQIYTPKCDQKISLKNTPSRSNATPIKASLNAPGSEDELGYDSSGDGRSVGRRRSRFGRLTRRRSGAQSPSDPTSNTEGESTGPHNGSNASGPLRRTRSSGDMQEQRKTRTSRRAIANSSESHDLRRSSQVMTEEENGAITYTANLLGSRPRIMDVCVPKLDGRGLAGTEWKKYLDMCVSDAETSSGNRMLNHLRQIQQRMENEENTRATASADPTEEGGDNYCPPNDFGLLALQNRPPWWNVELGSFVLNFGGRVSVASVKNFQLCDRTDQDYIMLQFGRIQGRHSFTMDFQYPLTAVQAFAIAISSLQSKISFG